MSDIARPVQSLSFHANGQAFTVSAAGLTCHWNGQQQFFGWGFDVRGEIVVDQAPRYAEMWGPGTRLRLPANWPGRLAGTVEVNLYPGRPGLVISGQAGPLPQAIELDRLPLLAWTCAATETAAWRWLGNSGHQGFSGSVGLAEALEDLPFSQDVTVLQQGTTVLALGNLSFGRTNILFERSWTPDSRLTLGANLAYGGLRMPAGHVLELESLLLLPHRDPLAALETYADSVVAIVKPQFHTTLQGLYNQWYANWTPTSDHGTADLILSGARQLQASGLLAFSISALGSGVWQNQAAFSEDTPWPGNFPEGIAAVSRQVAEMGLHFMHGGFWGKASACAGVFREHPEWMAQDAQGQPAQVAAESWGACRVPYYLLDITLPEVQDWFRAQWRQIQQASTGFYWLDFYGTGLGIDLDIERPAQVRFHDRRLAFPFETDRLMTRLIRETLGRAAVIGVYTSPTFNLIGLIDRARIALDVGAVDAPGSTTTTAAEAGAGNTMITPDAARRWRHVKTVARNVAAGYFCHNRFWVNDADPAMVGLVDRPETLEEARVRLMIVANSGGFVTVGEAPERIPPARLALLKQILPPYGQAARPLDLLESDVAGLYDLTVETSWDRWHIVSLINWDDEQRAFTLSLARLGITGKTLAYEYWEARFLGAAGPELEVTVPPRSGRLFCLRPLRPHPWLLSTDLHVSQGGVEVLHVAWEPGHQRLVGTAMRPAGQGRLIIHCPPPYQPLSGQVNAVSVPLTRDAQDLLSIPLQFDGQMVPWSVQFEKVLG